MDFDKYAALSPDVAQLVESRQQTQASIEQYQDLLTRLLGLLAAPPAKDQVLNVDYDLGAAFTCQAVIADPTKIRVALGVDDLYAELSLDQACTFCERKIHLLQGRAEELLAREHGLRKDLDLITDKLRTLLKPAAA